MDPSVDDQADAATKDEVLDDLYDDAGQDEKAIETQPDKSSAATDDDEYAKAFDSPPTEAEGQEEAEKVEHVSQAPETTPNAAAPDTSIPDSIALPATSPHSLTEATQGGSIPPENSGVLSEPNGSGTQHISGDSGAHSQSAPASDETPNITAILAALKSGQPSAVQVSQPSDSVAGGFPAAGVPGVSDNLAALAHPAADLPSKPPVPATSNLVSQEAIPANVSQSVMNSPPVIGTAASFLPPNYVASAPATSDSFAHVSLPNQQLSASYLSPTAAAGNFYYVSSIANTSANGDYQTQWDTYAADEQRYTAEQKWSSFPEGARLFVGNLSSDKVSKRDVFDVFHHYGRLAQISLKSAFGFVQYHTAEEARQALENLQDHEIKGRKIHIEVSRSKKQQDRDGDRGGRGNRAGKSDGGQRRSRDGQQGRGEFRGHGWDENQGRNRQYTDPGRPRDRSASPRNRGRDQYGSEHYRGRSPSPYSRSRQSDSLRYSPAKDVLFLILDDVDPQYVNWVRQVFSGLGLSTDIHDFRYGGDQKSFMRRKAMDEGVRALVDVDRRAHQQGAVTTYVFDMSRPHDIRYDQFPPLPVDTAAQLVLKQLQERGYRNSQAPQAAYSPYSRSQGYSVAPQYQAPYPGGQGSPQDASFSTGPPGAYPFGVPGYGAPTTDQPQNLQDIIRGLQHPGAAPAAPGALPSAHSPQGYGLPSHPFASAGAAMPGTNGPAGYGPTLGGPTTQQSVDSIMANLARLRGGPV